MLLLALSLSAQAGGVQDFLDAYNSLYVALGTAENEAEWAASTDVRPETEGRRTGASQVFSAFLGDPALISQARGWLDGGAELDPLQERQLRRIILLAGDSPGDKPALVAARVAAESRAAAVQDGFQFCLEPRDPQGVCPHPLSANDIDGALVSETDLDRRLAVWEASKEIGRPLKPELVELQRLRNQVAREMGYSSYFGLEVADYGMQPDELMTMLDGFSEDMRPLYSELYRWAGRALAERYQQPVPDGPLPAQWFPNRWAQEWPGLVQAADLDPYFADRTPESVVHDAEDFFVSMGFDPLPPSFWERSDLYPVPGDQVRRKNSHASAWHMDYDHDVRSLMSVQADEGWYLTAHHELGHIFYFLSYSRPEVPPLLRRGANRAFHEAVGELVSLAAAQVPYLRQRGILPRHAHLNQTQAMLDEALVMTVSFLPFSVAMSHFEYELYEKDLPPEQWQRRWWELVGEYQRVVPPSVERLDDPALCDACTKTHIIDDPAGYYDYTLATVIKYQLHEHIARDILHQDPRSCNYYGNEQVGDYLRGILEKGGTEDWRQVLRDATGEDLSTRAMVDYYAPLMTWLRKQNRRAR